MTLSLTSVDIEIMHLLIMLVLLIYTCCELLFSLMKYKNFIFFFNSCNIYIFLFCVVFMELIFTSRLCTIYFYIFLYSVFYE